MNKIVSIEKAIAISKQLEKEDKTIVLVGGCFDILHLGHIEFLKAAKSKGDILLVLLESDETIRKLKGQERPINPQNIRAEILASLDSVDYVILLPPRFTNSDYDAIIGQIKPAIIGTTEGDPNMIHKERQAKLTNAKIINVIRRIPNSSSSKLINELTKEKV